MNAVPALFTKLKKPYAMSFRRKKPQCGRKMSLREVAKLTTVDRTTGSSNHLQPTKKAAQVDSANCLLGPHPTQSDLAMEQITIVYTAIPSADQVRARVRT